VKKGLTVGTVRPFFMSGYKKRNWLHFGYTFFEKCNQLKAMTGMGLGDVGYIVTFFLNIIYM